MFGFGGQTGGQGGAASADFDSLIDLITSTVATETWAETGGGDAEIRPFPTGVMVDATGALKLVKATSPSAELTAVRGAAPSGRALSVTAGSPSNAAPQDQLAAGGAGTNPFGPPQFGRRPGGQGGGQRGGGGGR